MKSKILFKIVAPVLVSALLLCGCGPAHTTKVDPPIEVKPKDEPVVQVSIDAPQDNPAIPDNTVLIEETKPDTLANVKAKGVLVVGVRETAPPFGTVNPNTNKNEGYDIDFARYIANRLGVDVEFKNVTASNRIPMLEDGHVDMLAAAMSKTPEKAQRIDFSHTYFITGQKFLAQKELFKTLKDFEKKKIGTARGSTSEKNMVAAVPGAEIVSYDDYPKAINALRERKIQAVTTDEAILAGQLSLLEKNIYTKGRFEIPEPRISTETYGFGVRKNDERFLAFINETLIEMEQNGEAQKIFQRWFGPKSECPIKRGNFTIRKD
jgi:polar amino acid transport system substrate-binding protein